LEQLIHNYLDDLDALSTKVEEDAISELLTAIDIDELFKDPEGYLLALSDAFLIRHIPSIKKAAELGRKHSEKMLKNI